MHKNGIKAFRERLGLSQAELARRARTSRQQIGRLEAGHRKLTMDWAVELAKVLLCAPSDLMFPDNKTHPHLEQGAVRIAVVTEKEYSIDDEYILVSQSFLKGLFG